MKTGIIVYVAGNQYKSEEFDEKQAIRGLDIRADLVSFVFSGDSPDDLSYSWWEMVCKGMSRILCVTGLLTGPSSIQLTGRELQLTGY